MTPSPVAQGETARTSLLDAAGRADWVQVVLNGGPPCFHLEVDGDFCFRAERWHDTGTHDYVSLLDLLTALQKDRDSLNAMARLLGAARAEAEQARAALSAILTMSRQPFSKHHGSQPTGTDYYRCKLCEAEWLSTVSDPIHKATCIVPTAIRALKPAAGKEGK